LPDEKLTTNANACRACALARAGTVQERDKPNCGKNVEKTDQLLIFFHFLTSGTKKYDSSKERGQKLLDHYDHEQSIDT